MTSPIKVGDTVRVTATNEEIHEAYADARPGDSFLGYVHGEVFVVGYVDYPTVAKSERDLWLGVGDVELVKDGAS